MNLSNLIYKAKPIALLRNRQGSLCIHDQNIPQGGFRIETKGGIIRKTKHEKPGRKLYESYN